MDTKKLVSNLIYLPLSKLYGAATAVRNWMFDIQLLKEKSFDVPVVVVGNLSAGGTGKTPHVEYIVEALRLNYHLGVLSRGYKRATKGFVMATKRSTPSDIGDEPWQIYHKFNGEVRVAVCEDRVAGINDLLAIDGDINMIILDDAYQHRYVKPTVSILLTEYANPFYRDHLLPYGRLRESRRQVKRADIVIATKCPDNPTGIALRVCEEDMKLQAFQRLFYSKILYGALKPVFPDQAPANAPSLEWLTEKDMILAVAGIGNPRPFVRFIKHFRPIVRVNVFPDHHNFTRKDMKLISDRFVSMKGVRNLIITTEKDAVRLANSPYFPHNLKPYIYYLPIKVDFLRDEGDKFIDAIRKVIKTKKVLGTTHNH